MIRFASLTAFLILTGCSADSIADMDCSDVAAETVRISKGSVVAINNRVLTTNDDSRIVCHGTALYQNGSEIPARFQAFKGDDGETLVRLDTDEYQAAIEAKAKREQQQEEAQADQQSQKEWDQAMSDARYEAYAATAPDSTPVQ